MKTFIVIAFSLFLISSCSTDDVNIISSSSQVEKSSSKKSRGLMDLTCFYETSWVCKFCGYTVLGVNAPTASVTKTCRSSRANNRRHDWEKKRKMTCF